METSCTELDDEAVNSLIKKIKETLHTLQNMENESKIPIFIDSLSEIAVLIYLSREKSNLLELSNKVIIQICSVVFSFETKPYDTLLTSISENKNLVATNSNWAILEFFQKMHSLLQIQDYIFGSISGNLACASLMKKIMLDIFRKKRTTLEPLKILSLFCAMCGLDIPLLITKNSCCNSIFKGNEERPNLDIVALSYVLEGCSTCAQYFNLATAADRHLAPCKWLEGIIPTLLDVNYAKNKNIWLSCFRSLFKMSITVVENNLIAIIKSTLLKITVDDAISMEEYSNLFIDLISLYSRLQQLPNFFVQLLLALTETIKENSLGQLIAKGQVYPVILKATTFHFQELPYGQTVELWKIFSETYTTFGNMSQVFPEGKGAVLFLAQFFSSFLMHSNLFGAFVPSVIYNKFGDLILHTNSELKKNIHILFDGDKEVLLLQQSFLMLCFALGEVKLVYNECCEETLNNDLVLRFPHNVYDCTLLLKFLNEEHMDVFYSMLKNDDKVLSFLVFQLLIQKIRGLLHKKALTEDESTNLQNSVSCIIDHIKENTIYSASWNFDMCTLNASNYGSAVWRVFLKHLPLVLNSVDIKSLLTICECFHSIILQEQCSFNASELNLKTAILSALHSTYFQESKYFQVAFVASIWKFDSDVFLKKRSCDEMETEENFSNILLQLSVFRKKWTKYFESTPKCNQDETLNSLWSNLKDTCSLLNQILLSKSIIKPKLKIETFNVLQLIDCLPLEYLLPGNQVRCIIGLSVFLFLTPESCNQNDAIRIAEEICRLLVAIFDGARSIWFFDFINAGAYMRELVNTFEKLMNMKRNDETLKWIKLLFNRMMYQVTKNRETLVAVEEYFSELNNEKEISEISSLTLLTVLKRINEILKKNLSIEFKESCVQFAYLLSSCCVKYLKNNEQKSCDLIYSILIECYIEIINILTTPACSFDEKKKEKYLKQLPKIMKIAQQNITDVNNDRDAYFKFFTSVCNHNEDISHFMPQDFFSIIWDHLCILFQQKCSIANAIVLQSETLVEHPISFKEEEVNLLQSLFALMPQQNINAIVETLFQKMENVDLAVIDVFSFQMNLNIIQQIIVSNSMKPKSTSSSTIFINLFPQLCLIALNKANDSDFNISMIKIPILQFINFILRQEKCVILRKELVHCLQICDAVILLKTMNNLPLFLKHFTAVWNVVYNLLIYHSEIALSSKHSFVYTVIILLKSFMPVCSQDMVSAQDASIQLQILKAAQNIEGLMTMMVKHKESFAKLVPNLVAEYVNCIQHITLETKAKDHLISGINQLLSICSEESIKCVAVNINDSCRDIFTNIVKNYKQFRYKGDV